MQNFETFRKAWNKNQTIFRDALLRGQPEAMPMFFNQHAALHSQSMSGTQPWSFEDEIFSGLSDQQLRIIPPNQDHSILWCIWHLARIEDVTMNMLVVGQPQLYSSENWAGRLNIRTNHTGNSMSGSDTADLSTAIHPQALRAYRSEVGRRTREIVRLLSPEDLKRPVDSVRLQNVRDEGALLPEAEGLLEYWGNRNIAGLLLMPPTRHNFVHLNECLAIKKKVMR